MSFKPVIAALCCAAMFAGSPAALSQESWDLDWDGSTPPPNPPFADPRGGGESVAGLVFTINGNYNVLNWIGGTGQVLGIGGANNTTGVTLEVKVIFYLREVLIETLQSVTGESHATPGAWEDWWKTAEQGYRLPTDKP